MKRGTSFISIAVALIITGILTKIGELLLTTAIDALPRVLPDIGKSLLAVLLLKFEVNVLTILTGLSVFLFVLFPVYRNVDRLLLRRKRKELIFEDSFLNNSGWYMNYWGTTNHSKTNRIEDSKMIFEATMSEIANMDGFFGAFYDLKNGVYQGNIYQVTCSVRSANNATMGFQLWLHDTKEHAQIITPSTSTTPPDKGTEVSLQFKATQSNALRIHLHCRGGTGEIIVDKVTIFKIGGTNTS